MPHRINAIAEHHAPPHFRVVRAVRGSLILSRADSVLGAAKFAAFFVGHQDSP
jgi:hypothetical protein